MFNQLYEINNTDYSETTSPQQQANDCEQWHIIPAHTEELPAGLIADEI